MQVGASAPALGDPLGEGGPRRRFRASAGSLTGYQQRGGLVGHFVFAARTTSRPRPGPCSPRSLYGGSSAPARAAPSAGSRLAQRRPAVAAQHLEVRNGVELAPTSDRAVAPDAARRGWRGPGGRRSSRGDERRAGVGLRAVLGCGPGVSTARRAAISASAAGASGASSRATPSRHSPCACGLVAGEDRRGRCPACVSMKRNARLLAAQMQKGFAPARRA